MYGGPAGFHCAVLLPGRQSERLEWIGSWADGCFFGTTGREEGLRVNYLEMDRGEVCMMGLGLGSLALVAFIVFYGMSPM